MIYLPDTNVFSRYLRGRVDDLPLKVRLETELPACRLSSIVLMELAYGVAKNPGVPHYGLRLAALRSIFVQVDSFDEPAADAAGYVRAYLANLKPNAQPVGPYDALLAGQALAMGATLVTGNAREFSRIPGLRMENW